MTLNTQRDSKETLRRRASTPLTASHQAGPGDRKTTADPQHPALGHSASYHPGDKTIRSRASWSSDSEDSDSSGADSLYRVVLLGDPGVGKSSLANIYAGTQEKDANEHRGGRSGTVLSRFGDSRCMLYLRAIYITSDFVQKSCFENE
ncbi:UNVERIFIED_CONTAM: hypothetical protein FKN15_001001 [Acipenser sinensis]